MMTLQRLFVSQKKNKIQLKINKETSKHNKIKKYINNKKHYQLRVWANYNFKKLTN